MVDDELCLVVVEGDWEGGLGVGDTELEFAFSSTLPSDRVRFLNKEMTV